MVYTVISRTANLWPVQANEILMAKGVQKKYLDHLFREIIYPENPEYNSIRFFYQLQNSELPLFIIKAQSIQEIINALDLLFIYSLRVRILNGRHSSVIINPDFYLDVTHFKKITINDQTLTVGGGATQGEVYRFLSEINENFYFIGSGKHNYPTNGIHMMASSEFAFPGGSAATVGISGLTSAGGLGSFKRTLGLAVDNVLSYDIVVPPNETNSHSKLQIVTAEQNADLFWALSGGVASNFGVITSITYKTIQVHEIISYGMSFDWNDLETVFSLWYENAPKLPNEFNEDLSAYVQVSQDLTAVKGVVIGGEYVIPANQTREQALRIIEKKLQYLFPYSMDFQLSISTFDGVIERLSSSRVYHPFSFAKLFMSHQKINPCIIIENMEKSLLIPGYHIFGIELLGGKISKVANNATAYFPRDAPFFYDLFTYWDSSLDTCSNKQWINNLFHQNYNVDLDTVFVGFPINNLPNHLKAYYGTNESRLRNIKHEIDPFDLLRFPSGIQE